MIREDRFLISRKPYAVDLSTVRGEQHDRVTRITFSGSADAVWFRRKNGTTYACVGSVMLWSHTLPALLNLDDPLAVLSANLDGRHGGTCHGRWDGARYWGAQEPEEIAAHLELLRPMLDNYPACPPGYAGWYRF